MRHCERKAAHASASRSAALRGGRRPRYANPPAAALGQRGRRGALAQLPLGAPPPPLTCLPCWVTGT
eukprot:4796751-Prymnesium_polylepis.1